MKSQFTQFAKEYRASLRDYLLGNPSLKPARALGHQALAAGLEMLDLAKIHDRSVSAETQSILSSLSLARLIKKAGLFFAEVITPIEAHHRGAREAAVRLAKLIETLDKRTIELAASNRS